MTTKIWSYVVLAFVVVACVASHFQPGDIDKQIDLSPATPADSVGIEFVSPEIAKRGYARILIHLLYLPHDVDKAQWIGVIRIPPAFSLERGITVRTSHQEGPYPLPYKTLAEGVETSVKTEWALQRVGLTMKQVEKDKKDNFKFLQIEIPVAKIVASHTIDHWLSIEIDSVGHDDIIHQINAEMTELKIMMKLEIDQDRQCWRGGFCSLWYKH